MYSLYAFARTTDDLGDSHDHVDLRTSRLSWWREVTRLNLKEVLASDKSHDAEYQKPIEVIQYPRVDPELAERARVIFPALRDTAIQFSIPPRYFLEIIDGVMADQQKTRFDTYEQVEHYCYLVASAVGLTCLHIWDEYSPIVNDTDVFMTWTMFLNHPRLRNGDTVRVEGASYLRTRNGKVYYHRDYFDLGSMLYENLPLFGRVIRQLKSRLGQ